VTQDAPARVGINAIFLLPGMGGLETYVQELVPELVRAAPQTRFTVYCSPAGERHLRASAWASEVRLRSHPLFGTSGLKAACEMTVLGALASEREDLLHSVALTAPLRTRAANVITIADTTWFEGPRADTVQQVLALTAPLRTRAANVITIADTTWFEGPRADTTTLLWRVIVPPIARRADRLIAISQAGRRDIVDHLRIPVDRIDLTLLGHRPPASIAALPASEVRGRFGLGDAPFVLMVGTRKPHKNVDGLLRAFAQVAAEQPGAALVLAGNPTALEPDLLGLADTLGLRERVHFLGFVAPDELEGLYSTAACFVLPSHNEGFGLPVLEAMGRGVAVACSSASALPEVGGEAVRYFDPDRPGEIAATLAELLRDPELRVRLGAAGRARAGQLTWRATAEATLESYRRAHRATAP
jgi:glycosyltransferase involved in cell wall biosynthesis